MADAKAQQPPMKIERTIGSTFDSRTPNKVGYKFLIGGPDNSGVYAETSIISDRRLA